jgi:hypothetical protein
VPRLRQLCNSRRVRYLLTRYTAVHSRNFLPGRSTHRRALDLLQSKRTLHGTCRLRLQSLRVGIWSCRTHPTAKNKLEEIARSHADPSLGPCPFCNSPQRFRGSILVVGGFGGRQIAWFRPDLLKSWGLRLTSGAKVDASAIACSRCGKIVASLYPKALAILVRTA